MNKPKGYKRLSQRARLPHWGAGLQVLMSFPWRASLRKCSLGEDLQERREEGALLQQKSVGSQFQTDSPKKTESHRARKKKLTAGLAGSAAWKA